MNMCSLGRWNRFYINTEPVGLSGYFFHINTIQKVIRHLKKFCIQATHFQCCHNHLKSIYFQERALTRSGTNAHYLLDSCHVTAWSRWHMTCWVWSSHSSHHPAKFVDLVHCETEDKIFLTDHVTTQLKCHVNLSVDFPHPKSPHC